MAFFDSPFDSPTLSGPVGNRSFGFPSTGTDDFNFGPPVSAGPVERAIVEEQPAVKSSAFGDFLGGAFLELGKVGVNFGVQELGNLLNKDNDDNERREHTGSQPNQPRPAGPLAFIGGGNNTFMIAAIAGGALLLGLIGIVLVRR